VPRQQAAAAGGYALNSFYRVARSDLQFRAAWKDAHAVSAATERGLALSLEDGPGGPSTTPLGGAVPLPEASSGRKSSGKILEGEERIVPGNRRVLQRRKMRHVRFDEARQQAFLAHFCWSCDAIAAAAEVGICERTVYAHRRRNPGFAAEFQEALEQGYVRLDAEALRQRLEAQQRLRAAMDGSEPRAAIISTDAAAEFERVLKLLWRWDRRKRRPDRHAAPDGRRQVWTFDAAIELLGKRLKALGVAVPPLPPEAAARYDGPEGPDGGREGPR
jgi:hypothetical protein